MPSVTLAVISKMGEEASLLGNWLVFLHLLYTSAEKQPYLMSTSCYKLSIKSIYFSCASDSNGVYKNHVRQNGG